MTQKANYRKHNDHSHSSSTYHKKDGTAVRQILKRDIEQEQRTERLARAITRNTEDEALIAKKTKDARKLVYEGMVHREKLAQQEAGK